MEHKESNSRYINLQEFILCCTSVLKVHWLGFVSSDRSGFGAPGWGYPVLVRGIVIPYVAVSGMPVLLIYSGTASAEMIRSSIAATFLTAAFTSTIRRDGAMAGIPFSLCAVCILNNSLAYARVP